MSDHLSEDVLSLRELSVEFPAPLGGASVVDRVSLSLRRDEALGMVGESGSGKTMIALSLLRLVPEPGRIAGGAIRVADYDVLSLGRAELDALRGRDVGMVFQNPMSAFNPVRTIGWQLAASRLPTQFSGGQRQRIAIARALASSPRLVIADEPVSALDVSIQAQIINLLLDIQRATGIAYLVISHDIALVHQVADRVVVLYLGRVVEEGPAEELILAPRHPYTAALVSAVPDMNAAGRCLNERPVLEDTGPGRRVACFRSGELAATAATISGGAP